MTPADNLANDIGGYFIDQYLDGEMLRAVDLIVGAGAVLGFLAQLQARARMGQGEYAGREGAFAEVATKGGRKFYFGDAINDAILGEISGVGLWNYVAGAAEDPDIQEKVPLMDIFQHVSSTAGADQFGEARLPEGLTATETPMEALRKHAGVLFNRVLSYEIAPKDLTPVYGTAGHKLVRAAAGEFIWKPDRPLEKPVAIHVFMECAIPMSKVDPAELGFTR